MYIAYITVSYPCGTGEEFIGPEIVEFARRGHKIMIIPRSPEGESSMTEENIHLNAEPLISTKIVRGALNIAIKKPRHVLEALVWIFGTRTWARKIKNLVVYPKALWLADLLGKKKIEHIHAHWATTPSTMAMIASEITGIGWSMTAHQADIYDNNLLQQKIDKCCFARFISMYGIGLAKKTGVKDPGKKINIIHMGVGVPADCKGDSEGSHTKEFVIMCVASLLEVKGHAYLLHAMRKLVDEGASIKLLLVGDGPLRGELEELTKKERLDAYVQFLGYLPHREILEYYRERKVNMFILASIDLGGGDKEGIPVALMEAMSYGIPVVATNTGGIPELLDGGAGRLIEQRSASSIAEAIQDMLRYPELRVRYSRKGRERIEKEFSIDKVVTEMERKIIGCAKNQAKASIIGTV